MITLNKIREHSPCQEGWTKLLRGLGKTGPDDEPLALTTVLSINGLDDAIWCLRALEGAEAWAEAWAEASAAAWAEAWAEARYTAWDAALAKQEALFNDYFG